MGRQAPGKCGKEGWYFPQIALLCGGRGATAWGRGMLSFQELNHASGSLYLFLLRHPQHVPASSRPV